MEIGLILATQSKVFCHINKIINSFGAQRASVIHAVFPAVRISHRQGLGREPTGAYAAGVISPTARWGNRFFNWRFSSGPAFMQDAVPPAHQSLPVSLRPYA